MLFDASPHSLGLETADTIPRGRSPKYSERGPTRGRMRLAMRPHESPQFLVGNSGRTLLQKQRLQEDEPNWGWKAEGRGRLTLHFDSPFSLTFAFQSKFCSISCCLPGSVSHAWCRKRDQHPAITIHCLINRCIALRAHFLTLARLALSS